MNLLEAELERRKNQPEQHVTLDEIKRRLAELGYTLDRSMDCRSMARIISGRGAGNSYPCCTTGIREADTGMSAFHYQARRDDNFRALQALRGTIYTVIRGYIFEI